MNHRLSVAPLFAAAVLAACSTDVAVAPRTAPNAAGFAVSATKSGNYLVLMRGNRIADGFADKVESLGGTVSWAHGEAGFATVSGLSAEGATQLARLSGIADVQADAVVALEPMAMAEADAAIAADPSIDSQANPATAILSAWQWNMRLIGAPAAWAATPNAILGNKGVTVAILDTGIDYDLPDFRGPAGTVDRDLVDLGRSVSFMNSFVPETDTSTIRPADNVVSATFFPTRHPISDYNGHGTNVATQVSSRAFALAGVTSKTTLMGVKVLGSNGVGSFSQILAGVIYAADHGADVANMSLGGGFSKAGNGRLVGFVNQVFNYARQRGMLIVVSAGNDGSDLKHNGNVYSSFCDAPHVVCVSAVGPTTWTGNGNVPAFYTNFGRNIATVAAPGGNGALTLDKKDLVVSPGWPWAVSPSNPTGLDVASWVWSYCAKTRIGGWTIPAATIPPTVPAPPHIPSLTACAAGNRLSGLIGTSQASPHVAGLAALLVDKYGHGNPQDIKRYIIDSADPIAAAYGKGRINVARALGH
jgi:subtilisin family serine protease